MSNHLVSDPKRANRLMTRGSRFIFVLIATILLGTALFSASSAHRKNGDRVKSASATIDARTIVSERNSASLINKFLPGDGVTEAPGPFSALLPQGPPQPEIIATFAADCSTPKSSFILGEVACAKLSGGPPLSIYPRKITWVDTDNNILQKEDVTTDPQTSLFTIPLVSTSTDFRGVWRVNDISAARSSVRTSAFFNVSNPAQPAADLSVYKANDSDGTITAGSNIEYVLWLANKGPDPASNVVVTDATPANSTFLSGQISDTNWTCTFPASGSSGGTTTCTVASLAAGASAKLTLVCNVNTGTTAGTTISNTGNISSDTPDPHDASNTPPPADPNADPSNNTATSRTTVVAGAAGATCTLQCPDNMTANANTTEGGQRGAHVTYDPPVATGGCGSVSSTPASGSFFPVGTNVVTATSETGGGSCSFTITVVDNGTNPPTITCPPNKEADTAPNDTTCEATVDPGSPTTTGDNVTVQGTRSDGRPLTDPYPAGTTTITWSATSHDSSGNSTGTATCQQTITVHDKTPPTITCPADVSVTTPTGSCSATVNVGVPTATDNCDGSVTPVPSRSDNKPITDPFPVGTVTIHWTATDSSGNSSSCDQNVVVADNEPPVITCPSNVTTNTDPGTCSASNVNHGTATATDNCTVVTVSGTRSDGQPLDAPYPKGTTTITWTATDASGNKSSCTQTITVEDHEPPSISCPAPTSASADANCQAPIPDVTSSTTASDNCGAVTLTQSPAAGTLVTLGTYTITVTATDSSGNQSSCTTTFTVKDTTPPTITLSSQIPSLSPPNHKYVTFQVTDFVTDAHDNCDTSVNRNSVYITQVTSDEAENGPGSGNTLNDIVIAGDCKSVQLRAEREGGGNGRVYTIYLKVKDASGNVTTATVKVIVPVNNGGTAVDDGPHNTVISGCP